jgi:hypothetical protein
VFALAAIVLSAGPLVAGELTCTVAYEGDRITVHVERVPLGNIVREIGRQSGAEVVGDVRKPRDVSQNFDRVPLVDALGRLLAEQNFTLRYGPEGRLRTIDLLGAPLAAAPATQTDASHPERTASARQERQRGARSARATPAGGRPLVTAAGADTGEASNASPAPRDGLSEQDGTTQDQSSEVIWPEPDEFDRKLRRRFLDLLKHMNEAALAEYFATPDGQRTQTLLENFAVNHPAGDSSDKANDILRRLPGRSIEEPQRQP